LKSQSSYLNKKISQRQLPLFARSSAPGGIQPLTRTIGVIVGSMTRQKGGVAAEVKANSEIHIMHTIGAMPYHRSRSAIVR
jgi:hypothetical protein